MWFPYSFLRLGARVIHHKSHFCKIKHILSAVSNNSVLVMEKKLAVFDFDHTIVDDNTDIVCRNLLSPELIPASLKKLYTKDGWTAYMQGIFELLHAHKIKEPTIAVAIQNISATVGMPELITKLSRELNYDIIIISDSNSYLINTWLKHNYLKDYILKVFTNPAEFKSGLLKLSMYHLQTECKLSTKNLCKGKILEEFITEQKKNQVEYSEILYAGDGSNDFCPILRLKSTDIACVREKYKCDEMVRSALAGKPIAATGLKYKICAQILVWKNGFDILNKIIEP